MSYDYFYGQSGELFSYYRIPKALFQDSRFRQLSTDAKTLYGILLDRMSLSVKNGWLDEQNRVFIIFTIEDVKRALCCADNKATKLLRELEKFGLIERKRRGLGKPSLVYVKNFSAESSKSIFQNRDFHDSGGFKNASQDPSKSRCNKEVKTDGVHQIMIFLLTLEVMVLIIQFMSVVILQNIFFGVLSFIPFIAMVGGFEYAYQKKANEQNERTIQFRKRFYKVSAWLGTYFPIRLLAMALVHFYPRPINSLALECVIAVLYLMTATLITLEIEKRHLSKN